MPPPSLSVALAALHLGRKPLPCLSTASTGAPAFPCPEVSILLLYLTLVLCSPSLSGCPLPSLATEPVSFGSDH